MGSVVNYRQIHFSNLNPWNRLLDAVYVTIGNPAFCLFWYLTGACFRGEVQHVSDANEQKIKGWPIRTREIGGVKLTDRLYGY